jgi:hypothetical protein
MPPGFQAKKLALGQSGFTFGAGFFGNCLTVVDRRIQNRQLSGREK